MGHATLTNISKFENYMSLLELINHVGQENISVQNLLMAVTASNTNKKGETKLTFITKEITTNDLVFEGEKARKIGLILWMPTDKLPK